MPSSSTLCCNTTRYSVHINHGILSLLSVSDGLHSRHLVSYFRLLQRDKNNLEALRMLALHSLCRNGDITEVRCLQFFIPYMWITRNVGLFIDTVKEVIDLQEMFSASFLQSAKLLSNLISSLEILEPQNPELFYRMSLAFTRVVRRISPFTLSSNKFDACWLSVLAFYLIFFLGWGRMICHSVDEARNWSNRPSGWWTERLLWHQETRI